MGMIMPILLLFIDYESSEYPELEGGIRVVRYMSAKRQGKQIVVKPNDAGSRIIVEGYILPIEKPNIIKDWEFVAP